MAGRVSKRASEDTAVAASSVSPRALPTALTGLARLLGVSLGVSIGVLGWLSAQAATFGVAEHTHLTAHGLTAHRHDYAARLAAGAGAAAALAVVLLLLVHLSSNQPCGPRLVGRTTSPAPPARLVARCSPAAAALLFVAVEAAEFTASGTPAGIAAAVLASGAGLQVLAARVAVAITGALVHGIQRVSALPPTTAAAPHIALRTAAMPTRPVRSRPSPPRSCRAPPHRHAAFTHTT